MADTTKPNVVAALTQASCDGSSISVHPSWLRLIRFCAELSHGEIEKLKIQNGLPMLAEVATRKIKFTP